MTPSNSTRVSRHPDPGPTEELKRLKKAGSKLTAQDTLNLWPSYAREQVQCPLPRRDTIATVALSLSRDYLGIERDPRYLAMAERRLGERA